MPRLPRSFIKTSFFHVLVQGINKSFIFNHKSDINKYLDTINLFKSQYEIKIIAYCIMNNHAHLLIEVEELNNLVAFMHKINTIYARYYNKKYNRVGYVFRDRYKSEGIYSETHLYNCISYIHNNPVKANICKKPCDYEYSSAKEFNENCIPNDSILFSFLDIENCTRELCSNLINDFLKRNNISKKDLLKNKVIFKQLIVLLKIDNKMSYRTIEKELDISRETIRKMLL